MTLEWKKWDDPKTYPNQWIVILDKVYGKKLCWKDFKAKKWLFSYGVCKSPVAYIELPPIPEELARLWDQYNE